MLNLVCQRTHRYCSQATTILTPRNLRPTCHPFSGHFDLHSAVLHIVAEYWHAPRHSPPSNRQFPFWYASTQNRCRHEVTAHRSHCRESEPTASHPHEPLQVPQIAALVQIEVVTASEAMAYPYDQSVHGSLASKTFRVATKQPHRVSPDPRTREARVLYRSPEAEAINGIMSPGRSSGSRL